MGKKTGKPMWTVKRTFLIEMAMSAPIHSIRYRSNARTG